MARYTGPKRRLSRREGIALFQKDEKYLERKGAVPPGMHGVSRRRTSEYGLQLREKQKTKRIYGVLEKQMKKYFDEASKIKGATGLVMLRLLETRLDNVVYKLGFAKSRAQSRQMVSHGHVTVDGKKVNIPSYRIKASQVVALSTKLGDNITSVTLPSWLERKATVGKVLRLPERDDVEGVEERLIVEYFSR